jgi:hypothetical protein
MVKWFLIYSACFFPPSGVTAYVAVILRGAIGLLPKEGGGLSRSQLSTVVYRVFSRVVVVQLAECGVGTHRREVCGWGNRFLAYRLDYLARIPKLRIYGKGIE